MLAPRWLHPWSSSSNGLALTPLVSQLVWFTEKLITVRVSSIRERAVQPVPTVLNDILHCKLHFRQGDGGWAKEGKPKNIFWYPTQKIILARAGWPKHLGLVRTTPWADFAVISDQLWSTMTAVFWCVALSWYNWFLLRIIVNYKRDLWFEFGCTYFEHLVISHPDSDFLYERIVQSWFASIPSSRLLLLLGLFVCSSLLL